MFSGKKDYNSKNPEDFVDEVLKDFDTKIISNVNYPRYNKGCKETALIAAINSNKPDKLLYVQKLIDKKADVNLNSYYAYTNTSPLIEACKKGNLDIVKCLVENGADVNQEADKKSPLIEACKTRNLDIVKCLVENGADVNQEADKKSPLTETCQTGSLDIVKYLFDNGADINQEADKKSPLEIAYQNKFFNMIKFLVENGADITKPVGCKLPLTIAYEWRDLDMMEYLINHGASVDEKVNGSSLIAIAAEAKEWGIVKFLAQKGATVNWIRGKLGGLFNPTYEWSLLMSILQSGRIDVAKCLIEKGGNVNIIAGNQSPLTWACQNGRFDMVKYLVEEGADVNRIAGNQSPLILACQNGRSDMVEYLVEKGAKVSQEIIISDLKKLSALQIASENNHLPIKSYLEEIKKQEERKAQKEALEKAEKEALEKSIKEAEQQKIIKAEKEALSYLYIGFYEFWEAINEELFFQSEELVDYFNEQDGISLADKYKEAVNYFNNAIMKAKKVTEDAEKEVIKLKEATIVFLQEAELAKQEIIVKAEKEALSSLDLRFYEFWEIISRDINFQPKASDIHIDKANEEAKLGKYKEAINYYDKIIKASIEAYIAKGHCLKAIGEYDEALRNYSKALELNPDFLNLYGNEDAALAAIENFNIQLQFIHEALPYELIGKESFIEPLFDSTQLI